VILDLQLPRVPGTQILHYIRTDPRLAEIRVIVATAHPNIAAALQDRADWVLIKPVNFGQLRDLAKRFSPTQPGGDNGQ
jgi:CheY-like chemotaxis protein